MSSIITTLKELKARIDAARKAEKKKPGTMAEKALDSTTGYAKRAMDAQRNRNKRMQNQINSIFPEDKKNG